MVDVETIEGTWKGRGTAKTRVAFDEADGSTVVLQIDPDNDSRVNLIAQAQNMPLSVLRWLIATLPPVKP